LAGLDAKGEFTIDKMVKPDTHVGVVFQDDAPAQVVHAYARETSLSNEEEDRELFIQDFMNVVKPFRSLLAQSIFNNKMSNQIELLQRNNVTVLIIFGKEEKVIDPDYLDKAPLRLWQNKIFKIEGASHLVNIDRPEAFNSLLKQFVEDETK
jgi:pimeloyl-ACP methyl ester carboxylesterase